MPIFWSCINAVAFQDSEGLMITKIDGVDSLGTQLLGLALVSVVVIVVSWIYFFPMKRLNKLRVNKAVEVIGRDTLMNAESKGLDLDQVVEKIEAMYPQPKKRGC